MKYTYGCLKHCLHSVFHFNRCLWHKVFGILIGIVNIPVYKYRPAKNIVGLVHEISRYLSHQRAAKSQVSLRMHADSPEPSLLADTKYGCR